MSRTRRIVVIGTIVAAAGLGTAGAAYAGDYITPKHHATTSGKHHHAAGHHHSAGHHHGAHR